VKKTIITYAVSLLFATGILLLVCGVKGVLTTDMVQKEVVRFVCDGFFVTAILFLGIGGLTWASRMGTFDGLGYSFSLWKQRFTNHKRDWMNQESFADYKERMVEKKKGKKFNHFLIIGGVTAVIAAVLFVTYTFAF
jgi:hypothetical protein